ncbi:DUF4395 domain-containing protein [Sanguibacter sp. A247]|uniref:DUF4395 domain-containing protein n=1 Tax=unclassified Sanguibacter TaxID=2645534 RepID=UPI003FD85FC8
MASFFTFPNPVNERAARTVAAGVVALGVLTLVTQSWVPLAVLAAGFVGRVLAGPRLSPLGFVAQRVIAPRLGPARLVPGPPKRFAQGIGATLTTAALVAYLVGAPAVAWVLIGFLLVAASLEAFVGFCLGCWIFGKLQRAGLIPADVCEACNDISLRRPTPTQPA